MGMSIFGEIGLSLAGGLKALLASVVLVLQGDVLDPARFEAVWVGAQFVGRSSSPEENPVLGVDQEVGGEVDVVRAALLEESGSHGGMGPQERWGSVPDEGEDDVPHRVEVDGVMGQRALGIVLGNTEEVSVPDEGAVLDGVAVDDGGGDPRSLPDGDRFSGELAEDVEGPGVV